MPADMGAEPGMEKAPLGRLLLLLPISRLVPRKEAPVKEILIKNRKRKIPSTRLLSRSIEDQILQKPIISQIFGIQ